MEHIMFPRRGMASKLLCSHCSGYAYFVSDSFYADANEVLNFRLQQWLKRKILDAPTEADAGPTVSIRCPHGKLMPEEAVGAKRLLVPENLWLFLYGDATTVKPDDPLDCSTFPLDSRQCSQCCDELSEVACMEDYLRLF